MKLVDTYEDGWIQHVDARRARRSFGQALFAGLLVFITNAAIVNLKARMMVNVPRKHIGIFLGVVPQIWHYSNSQRKVVRQTPEQFSRHYRNPDNAMFWGVPP